MRTRLRKTVALLLILIVGITLPYYEYLYLPNRNETMLLSNLQDQIYKNRLGTASIIMRDSEGKILATTPAEISPVSLNFMLGAGVWTTTAKANWTQTDWDYYNSAGFEYEQIWTTWRLIEPTQNQFDFSSVQGQIDYVKAHNPHAKFFARLQGITLDPLIGNSLNDCTPPSFTGFTTSMPSDKSTYLAEVASYVRTLVAKYAGQIDVWITPIEINRVDLAISAFNLNNYPWSIQDAIEIDRTVALAVKQADPNATVILGTSTPLSRLQTNDNTRIDPIDFERNAIDSGVPFDDVAIEIYSFSGDLRFWFDYLNQMSNLERPIFVNEAGSTSEGFDYVKLESYGPIQAAWCMEILSLALATKAVVGFSFLEFKDRSVQQRYSEFETMGLLDFSGQPKQSYDAVLALLKSLTKQNITTSTLGELTIRALPGNYTINVAGAQGQFQVVEKENLTYAAQLANNGQIQLTLKSQATTTSSANQFSNSDSEVTQLKAIERSILGKRFSDWTLTELRLR